MISESRYGTPCLRKRESTVDFPVPKLPVKAMTFTNFPFLDLRANQVKHEWRRALCRRFSPEVIFGPLHLLKREKLRFADLFLSIRGLNERAPVEWEDILFPAGSSPDRRLGQNLLIPNLLSISFYCFFFFWWSVGSFFTFSFTISFKESSVFHSGFSRTISTRSFNTFPILGPSSKPMAIRSFPEMAKSAGPKGGFFANSSSTRFLILR